MALGYLDDSKLYAIASAIRSKTSKSATMTVDEMPDEIESISTGAVVEPLSVTANGTYTAPAGQGYTPVTVSVPQEGITVDNIALKNLSGVVSGSAASIVGDAFSSYGGITEVSFPNALSIGPRAFQNCGGLEKASFQALKFVRENAFRSCNKLTDFSAPVLQYISSSCFYGCRSLQTLSLPSVSYVGEYAFQGCSKLETVSLPIVDTIAGSAFRSCFNLIELYLTSVSSVTWVATTTFSSTPIGGYSASAGRYGSVFVPASLYSAFLTATGWSSISSRIVSVP